MSADSGAAAMASGTGSSTAVAGSGSAIARTGSAVAGATGLASVSLCPSASNSRNGPCDRRVERPDRASHRDPDHEVAPPPDGRREAVALAPDDDRERSAQIRLANRKRCVGLRANQCEPRGRGDQ